MKNIVTSIKDYYWTIEDIGRKQPVLIMFGGTIIIYFIGNITSIFNNIIQYLSSISTIISQKIYGDISNGLIDTQPYFIFALIIHFLFLIIFFLVIIIDSSVGNKNTYKLPHEFLIIGFIIFVLTLGLQVRADFGNSKIIDFQKEILRVNNNIVSEEKVAEIHYRFSIIKSKNDYDTIMNELKELKNKTIN